MKYRRLKSIAGDGTIMRYYDLASGEEALCNCFYEVGKGLNTVTKIEGAAKGELIGFSHGGDNLVPGKIFLDINPAIVYMGILEDGDERPNIGEVVNGYQKVIDTHYDGDEGVTNIEWDIEQLDNPYYLFTIIQPEGTAAEVVDEDAGEESGRNFKPVTP